ncbi:NAD(+) diphosphatase [Gleimia hominis]|uniref:NAD(+) diphosphatase n=1 Tax=Gleimia hominis TaxID=595468 RepID=A0ABU3IEA5_9ACTO|nr:NAD(+) diphosphatase [Gleimia hominis]MDT3767812.1 NAD(+) diphosphatase [Gleimia hominis]
MRLQLPLASGEWEPCTYAREYLDPLALAQNLTQNNDPEVEKAFLHTIRTHCPGQNPQRIRAIITADSHRFAMAGHGVRHRVPDVDMRSIAHVFFLGVEQGTAILGMAMRPGNTDGYSDIRRMGPDMDPTDAQMVATCSGLASWHDRAQFCARCGGPTRFEFSGWQRTCRSCGATEYPRTDPSIITAITDASDRLLVAHNTLWRPGYASLVAGFMEMGEAPEQTVRRETKEEVGLEVDQVRYVGAQAWPFPRSLMLGFTARTTTSQPAVRVDGVEIDWARFYTREEYAAALTAGEVGAPGAISIAHAMIRRWFGGPLPHVH